MLIMLNAESCLWFSSPVLVAYKLVAYWKKSVALMNSKYIWNITFAVPIKSIIHNTLRATYYYLLFAEKTQKEFLMFY